MPTIKTSRERAIEERLQAHRVSETEYRVYNVAKGTSYSCVMSTGGVWSCTCPFMTRGSRFREGVCKHLTRVMDKLRGCGVGTCREGKLCASCRFSDKMME